MTSHSGDSVEANIKVAGFRFKERISIWVGCSAEMVDGFNMRYGVGVDEFDFVFTFRQRNGFYLSSSSMFDTVNPSQPMHLE